MLACSECVLADTLPPSRPPSRPHLLQVAVLQQQLGGLIGRQVVDAARIAQLLAQLRGSQGHGCSQSKVEGWSRGWQQWRKLGAVGLQS